MADGWVTQREAACLLGVHQITVAKMVRRGLLTPRRKRPSLSRREVLALARAREAAAAELEGRRGAPKGPQPPDDEHTWLRIEPAATVLGVSAGTLSNRTSSGRVPCTTHDHRRWFRLDHLEAIVRARVAEQRQDA